MPIKLRKMLSTTIIIIALALATYSHALANVAVINATDDVIVGIVVSVADGDTITVIGNKTQYRIRLFGIDAPERHQDFSNRARQFLADMVFGKQVRVIRQDIDRYGRIVGIVYVVDVCINEEMVRNGLVWVYRYYCIISLCEDWLRLELQAKEGKIGLWFDADPVPPWEYRRTIRSRGSNASGSDKTLGLAKKWPIVLRQCLC